MSGKHLNEEMLQQYALEPAACPPEAIAHLAECVECRIEVAGYLQLGKSLRDQPAPEFSFDLAAGVMAQLESGQGVGVVMEQLEAGRGERARVVVPVLIAIVAAFPAWFFRRTAYLVFADMPGAVAWIIMASAVVAVLFSFYKYYRRFQQVLQLINK